MCIKFGGWIEVIDWDDLFLDDNYLFFFFEGLVVYIFIKVFIEVVEWVG